jgi:HK97 family phage portal protein
MTTLQTADGRLLRAQRPAGVGLGSGFMPSSFPPEWSDGERHGDDSGYLKSYEGIYRSQPVVATVVNKITRRISTLPLDAYRELGTGSRELVRGDSLDSLIRRPMPRSATVHLVAHIAQSLLIHGNAVVAKLRTDPEAPPDMLWPLDWAQLNAYGQAGGTIEWWSTYQFGAEERFIAAADTVHFAWPGPNGGEIGVSPLEQLGVTIRIEDAAQRHQTAMFKNGVRPDAVVSLDDPGAKRDKLLMAKEFVEAAHKGMDRSGGWVFMGPNIKLQPLTMSPVEAALIDQRKLSREEVGMVYDLAGPLMNDLTHGTYSNVAELHKGLYRDVIPPWATLIVNTFKAQMLDQERAWLDRVLRFDFTDKLRGEPGEMASSLRSDVEGGLRTRNEAREIMGLEPADADVADELTANVNNQAALSSLATQDDPAGDPERVRALVEAAASLIRAGFEPEDSLKAVGLDPIEHLGLLPITLKSEDQITAEGEQAVAQADQSTTPPRGASST